MARGHVGTLPDNIAQALAAASSDQIRNVLEHAATDSLDQLAARLELV